MNGRLTRAVVGALLLLALPACGGKGSGGSSLPDGGGLPAGSTATGSTAPAGVDTRAIVAGYLVYWDALRHAQANGNPGDPLLAAHATGAALAEAVAGVRQNVAVGVRLHGTVGHRPSARVNGPDAAVVTDCLDLSRWLAYNARTGRPDRSVQRLRRFAATYTLTHTGGGWMVATVSEGAAC